MFKTNFFINPKRNSESKFYSIKSKFIFFIKNKLAWFGIYLGFNNINYSYVHGDKNRIKIGDNCSTMNSIFNVISGDIHIGNNTIFGHNCMILTGTHNFYNGKRISLNEKTNDEETPKYGRDIYIGEGCFIGSGVTIIGPVKIGDNVVIGSGSVVTKSLESGSFCAGVPARVIKKLNNGK